jgi:hypothetical protein
MKKTLLTTAVILSIVVGFQAVNNNANSRSAGAPSGRAGDPASSSTTCTSCHNESDASLPAGQGGISLSLNGTAVTGYYPDSTYNVTANVTATSASNLYGFETTPQNASGTYLGTLLAGTGSKITGTKYLTHSSPKSGSSATWNFKWTAPSASSGSVTFYTCFDAVSTHIYAVTNTFAELANPGGGTNGINNINLLKTNLYPNPANDVITISTCSASSTTITVFDLAGNEVINQSAKSSNGSHQIEVKNLANGVYFIKVNADNKSSISKFVKQ